MWSCTLDGKLVGNFEPRELGRSHHNRERLVQYHRACHRHPAAHFQLHQVLLLLALSLSICRLMLLLRLKELDDEDEPLLLPPQWASSSCSHLDQR